MLQSVHWDPVQKQLNGKDQIKHELESGTFSCEGCRPPLVLLPYALPMTCDTGRGVCPLIDARRFIIILCIASCVWLQWSLGLFWNTSRYSSHIDALLHVLFHAAKRQFLFHRVWQEMMRKKPFSNEKNLRSKLIHRNPLNWIPSPQSTWSSSRASAWPSLYSAFAYSWEAYCRSRMAIELQFLGPYFLNHRRHWGAFSQTQLSGAGTDKGKQNIWRLAQSGTMPASGVPRDFRMASLHLVIAFFLMKTTMSWISGAPGAWLSRYLDLYAAQVISTKPGLNGPLRSYEL